MESGEVLVYRCFPLGSVRPCYYDFRRKTTFWNRWLNFRVVDPPDGFVAFYDDAAGPGTAPLPMGSLMVSFRVRAPARAPSRDVSVDQPPMGDIFDISGPPPGLFRRPYFPADLFLLMSGPSLRTWLLQRVSSQERLLPCGKSSDVALLRSVGAGLPDQAKQLAKDILKYIAKAEPGRPYALAAPIIAQLQKYRDLVPEAGVRLLAETHTAAVSRQVRNAWDLFLLYSATFAVPRNVNDVLRAWMLLVAGCPSVDPEIARLASVCLFRLSCSSCVRVPFGASEDDHQSYILSVISRANHPTIFGVSLAEILHFEVRANEDVHRTVLVPQVVRRLVIYIRDEAGTALPDIFTNDRTPPDTLRKLVSYLTMGGRLVSGRDDEAGRTLELSRPGVYHAANLLKYFFAMLQEPLITADVITELAQTPVLDSARCLSVTYRLPNEHRDTLMFLVGFLQEILRTTREKILREDALGLVAPIYTTLFRPPADCQLHDSMQLLLAMLIESWRTDDVYLSCMPGQLPNAAALTTTVTALTATMPRRRRLTRPYSRERLTE
jgi:hypothetical protein